MSTRLGVAAALVDGHLLPGDITVTDGRIEAVGISPAGAGGLAVPGLVDIQVNGYAGVDLAAADDAGIREVRRALARDGVTSFLPTVITGEAGTTAAATRRLAAAVPEPGTARVLGVHLEGPWLSPERLGTHPSRHRRDPDPAALDRLIGPGVVAVTLAPEIPGALEAVRGLVGRGVMVLLGHSAATARESSAAFDLGARGTTHLFNAMSPIRGRDGGLAGEALTRPGVINGLIADGHHLSPELVRLAFAAAPGRIALVTDATAAAAMPDGDYRLGDVDVRLRDGEVRNAEGALAGSAATLLGCVRHCVAVGIDPAVALTAATATPAALLARPDVGVLRPGSVADVVVLDDDLHVRAALVEGREAA